MLDLSRGNNTRKEHDHEVYKPLEDILYWGLPLWMDLATDSKDKAYKLEKWIESARLLNTEAVNAILRVIERVMLGDDMERISFNFWKKLSTKADTPGLSSR